MLSSLPSKTEESLLSHTIFQLLAHSSILALHGLARCSHSWKISIWLGEVSKSESFSSGPIRSQNRFAPRDRTISLGSHSFRSWTATSLTLYYLHPSHRGNAFAGIFSENNRSVPAVLNRLFDFCKCAHAGKVPIARGSVNSRTVSEGLPHRSRNPIRRCSFLPLPSR